MKIVPCPKCGREAVGPKTTEFPSGAPVVIGRYTGGAGPLVVKCYRCRGAFKLDALAFARLPQMTPTQAKDLGLDR